MFRHFNVGVGVLIAGMIPAVVAAQAPDPSLLYACYVPEVGAVYRIKAQGLPTGCVEPAHVEFSWPAAPAAPPVLTIRSGEGVNQSLTPDASYDFLMYCNPGETAVGVSINRQLADAQVEVYASQPTVHADGRAGWELKVWYRSGTYPGLIFTAAVQCASVSSP